MRIAIITLSLSGGGAEFVARTWAGWLAREGHDVRLLTTSRKADDAAPPEGVRVISAARGSHRAVVQHTRSLLRTEPADAVLALQSYPNLIALASTRLLRSRPAVLVSERNITTREGEHFTLGERAKDLVAKLVYRRADLVVAISHPVAAELVSAYGIDPARVVVVPNPAAGDVHSVPQRPPIDPSSPVHLVLPMRLVPQKRAELAVEAAAVLRERGVDARVHCFGRGDGLADLETRAAELGVPLEVPGWTRDWVGATPPNSVVVLPSYREGFGNVLVEAAAGGIPSVAVSNSYGVADALVPGITGELALTGTAPDIADAIERASALSPERAVGWLARFSSDNSGRLLTDALTDARRRRRGDDVLVSAVGQYDNLGDTVLRRGFLDHLRTVGPLTVYVGDKSDDYASGLGLRAEDRVVRDGERWRRLVLQQLLRGHGTYAFDTGETEVRRSFVPRYLKLAPLLLVHRLRGGTAVHLGVGVRESSIWRWPIALVLRLCTLVSWRDQPSRRIMGLGTVSPDWAFALGAPAAVLTDESVPRPLLAISVRQGLAHAARERPSAEWIATVRALADDLDLEPVVVAQIARDSPLARELAAELGCEVVEWLDANHARQEARVRDTYRRSAIVLSDRLHALVIAATEGAVPLALSSGPMDKVTRTLEGVGITGTSISLPLDESGAISVARDALGRRADVMRAVLNARARLADLTRSVRSLANGDGS